MTEITPAHEHLEHAEVAEHAAHEGGLRAALVPLSIAVMAVAAGVLGILEGTASANAIIARSDAAIRRNEATDIWSQFQAESLKKHIYGIAAGQPGPNADSLKAQSDKYGGQEKDLSEKAKAKEKETEDQIALSEKEMEKHHRFSYATGTVQLAIALASISIVIRRRWFWYVSLACFVAGVGMAVVPFA
jgi:hypothetical protein